MSLPVCILVTHIQADGGDIYLGEAQFLFFVAVVSCFAAALEKFQVLCFPGFCRNHSQSSEIFFFIELGKKSDVF